MNKLNAKNENQIKPVCRKKLVFITKQLAVAILFSLFTRKSIMSA